MKKKKKDEEEFDLENPQDEPEDFEQMIHPEDEVDEEELDKREFTDDNGFFKEDENE
jgi:hypothetical protein